MSKLIDAMTALGQQLANSGNSAAVTQHLNAIDQHLATLDSDDSDTKAALQAFVDAAQPATAGTTAANGTLAGSTAAATTVSA